jgi:hypothetical protein
VKVRAFLIRSSVDEASYERSERTNRLWLIKRPSNALDDDTNVSQTWNSYGPAFPRWWGVVFSGKL